MLLEQLSEYTLIFTRYSFLLEKHQSYSSLNKSFLKVKQVSATSHVILSAP